MTRTAFPCTSAIAIPGRTSGSMLSDRMLASRSSTASEWDTPRTPRSSSTPITTIPPPEFANATMDLTTLSGELRSRLNSNDCLQAVRSIPRRSLLSNLLDTYSNARDRVTRLSRHRPGNRSSPLVVASMASVGARCNRECDQLIGSSRTRGISRVVFVW